LRKRDPKKIAAFVFLVVFVASLVLLLFFISPVELVEKLGAHNGYLLTFLVSLFGGFSAVGAASFISLLVTLVAGGMNPIALGLVAGVSLAIGDLLMFYIASEGRQLLRGWWKQRIRKLAKFFQKKEWLNKATPVVAYLYFSFAPLPNDIIIFFLAAVDYPPKKTSLLIVLGDLTFALTLALLASRFGPEVLRFWY
jgi:hypothetical protein